MPLAHHQFDFEVRFGATPTAVYTAFASADARRRWFRLPGSGATYDQDFRVGGGEVAHSAMTMPDGRVETLDYRSRFIDLVQDARLVYTYESTVNEVLRWASLVTVELEPVDAGTLLRWTEQVTFVTPTGDGSADLPHLKTGTRLRLNGLPASLDS